jgi:hypothetical protein
MDCHHSSEYSAGFLLDSECLEPVAELVMVLELEDVDEPLLLLGLPGPLLDGELEELLELELEGELGSLAVTCLLGAAASGTAGSGGGS